MTDQTEPLCHGVVPLTARTEAWMEDVLADPALCRDLLREHGSPVNLHDFSPLARNAGELVEAAGSRGVTCRVFVARKANKSLGLVDAATAAGHGIDVASLRELTQCLDRGVAPDDLIVSAAVKSDDLLRTALTAGVVVSLDNRDELDDVTRLAEAPAAVALRMAAADPRIPDSRFGQTADAWVAALASAHGDGQGVEVRGVHFHLNGYSAQERAIALREACSLVDRLRELGHRVSFIDMGGGVPMSYLSSGRQWRGFWHALDAGTEGRLTWHGDRLGLIDPDSERPSPALYPYWQEIVRGEWLGSILDDELDGRTVAAELVERGLELRCEPGRSVLDGCGMTLAAVAFTKTSRDGEQLVGLHMNRTQLRSTSADVLLDPRLVRDPDADTPRQVDDAFLVGAYCIEEELLLRRRFSFPQGVSRTDTVAFLNTGGYLMHILESASHQLPLARNLVHTGEGWRLDDIDAG